MFMPINKQAMHTSVRININGHINFHQALKLTLTKASDGSINPVGVIKPIMPIPNKYAFTISLPGTFTIIARAPIIGMVSTAIPDEEDIKRVNKANMNSKAIMKREGGILLTV